MGILFMGPSPKIVWPARWFFRLRPVEKFTAVLCVIAAFQGWAFIQSERSSLVISDVRFAKDLVANERPTVIIEIKNTSKSTAFIEDFRSFGGDSPTIPSPEVVRLEPMNMHPPVAPDVPVHIEIDVPTDFPKEIIDLINRGRYHIWIIGSVEYGDRFKWFGGGKTGFCFYYDPSRGRGADSFYRCHDPRYEYAE